MTTKMGYNWPNAVVTYVNHWDQQTTTYANRARPFQVAASHGVGVMRTFFGTVDSITAIKSGTSGVATAAWAALGELLDTANANGVKLVLSNYLTQQTIEALSGTTYASWAAARVALTTSGSSAWNGLKDWIDQATTHFATHPAVFSWEVVNEPGYMLGMDDGSITRDSGCAFLDYFQTYLKTDGATKVNGGGRPLYDKSLLTDAQLIAATQDLDYLDDHFYPDSDTAANHLSLMDTYTTRVNTLLGRTVPVIIGEFGSDPETFLDDIADGAIARGWLPLAWGYDAFDIHEFNETDEPYVLTKIAAVNAVAFSGATGSAARVNLSPNPSLKTTVVGNGTDWTSSPSGYARQTGVTGMDRSTGFGGSGARDIITTPRFAAIAGEPYVASFQIKTGASNTFKVLINWYTGTASGSSFISNSGVSTSFTVNGTRRCEVGPFTAPAGAGGGYVRIIELDSTTVTLSALIVERVSTPGRTYFDGDTTGATWASVSGNSISYLIIATDAWAWSESAVKSNVALGPTGGDAAHWAESAAGVATGTIAETITWSESAMVIGLGYDDRRGRVRVSAFGLAATARRAQVNRRLHGIGRYAPVRGGKVAISNRTFDRIVDDYEFPANVAVDYQIIVFSSPADAPDVIIATAFATQQAIEPDVWLKFIAAPSLNQKIVLTGWDAIGRTSRNARFDVISRPEPIVVTDVHSSRSMTIAVRTTDIADGEALDHALSAGAPAFLHTPVGLALPSMYVAIGDYSYTKPSTYSHVRTWTIAVTEVTPPPPSVFGPATTCQSILDTYDTCQEVLDNFDTCAELVS